MKHRTPMEQQQINELRDKLAMFEGLGYTASAKEVRRKLRALQRGVDPDAPKIDTTDRRPRKRVIWSRPLSGGRYFVRLTCRHTATVNGVPSKQTAFLRAPYTAICTTCNPSP